MAACLHLGALAHNLRVVDSETIDQSSRVLVPMDWDNVPAGHTNRSLPESSGELNTTANGEAITSSDGTSRLTGRPLEYVSIPLNGGSEVEEVGYRNGVRWGMNLDWPTTGLPLQCAPHLIPRMAWRSSLLLPGAPTDPFGGERETFCTVRNPYMRVISLFVWDEMHRLGCRFALDPENCIPARTAPQPRCESAGLNDFVIEALGGISDELSDSWPMATAEAPQVDDAAPTTEVQVRLATGPPQRLKLNRTHTVADLKCLVERALAAAGAAPRAYTLAAGFPPKPLLDDSLSLEAAGLLNAAVTQRWA